MVKKLKSQKGKSRKKKRGKCYLLKPHTVEKELIGRRITILSPIEFQRIFNVSESAAGAFLNRYSDGKVLVKLRNGLYAVTSRQISDFEIANKVYKPSYISFEFALSYYGIIPETVYSITSATTKITRNFEVMNKSFEYHKIKKKAFTGYNPEKAGDATILLADKEKALTDYLYFVSLKKKGMNDRLNLKGLSKRKIKFYAKLFESKKLNAIINKLLNDK